MLELINNSPFAVNLYPGFNKDGEHQLTCVIKAGFSFDTQGKLQLLEPTPSINETDIFKGDINQSSLLAANEIMPFKYKHELLLYGTAQVPHKNSLISEVSIRIYWPDNDTSWHKQLRIFGPRTWQKTLFVTIPSTPEPLQPVSLQYEHAVNSAEKLPQIELMPHFVTRPTDQPAPAGFAPIPSYWLLSKSTSLPNNIYSMAPQDQQFTQPFLGDEKILLKGMLSGLATTQAVTIKLPTNKPKLLLHLEQQAKTLFPNCDTVVINTDAQTLHMIWRTGIPWQINDQRYGTLTIKDITK